MYNGLQQKDNYLEFRKPQAQSVPHKTSGTTFKSNAKILYFPVLGIYAYKFDGKILWMS
jgi:hypothetical protein